MRKLYLVAVLTALTAHPATASAQVRERTVSGAAIGAGAVVAGPVGPSPESLVEVSEKTGV